MIVVPVSLNATELDPSATTVFVDSDASRAKPPANMKMSGAGEVLIGFPAPGPEPPSLALYRHQSLTTPVSPFRT